MFAGALGVFKELMDLVGTIAYRVATITHAPSILVRMAARMRGDPDVMDLVADARGLCCAIHETLCSSCCDSIYP